MSIERERERDSFVSSTFGQVGEGKEEVRTGRRGGGA